MINNFGDIAFTPRVRAFQEALGSREKYARLEGTEYRKKLTAEEIEFISERDSFYLATVGENGWPYMQYRGGTKGFLRVMDEQTLGFADFKGNAQYISLGNVTSTGRACLFLMDYPNRFRLKIWADAKISEDPQLISQLSMQGYPATGVRAFLFSVHAFDWNCQQHIVQRYTPEEYELAISSPGSKGDTESCAAADPPEADR